MDTDIWAYVKVKCTDGVVRLGMNIEDESTEFEIVQGGLHYEYAAATVELKAKELGMETYDGEIHDYVG